MSESLSVYEFGRRLLETRDLDPVYVVLHSAAMDAETLRRWLLAYWSFYHVGTASWITEGGGESNYWSRFLAAAGSKEYPRCHERRHYRGRNALNSVTWLSAQGLSGLFDPILNRTVWVVADLMKYVQTWIGFGPWVAFKVADMVERLELVRVRFDRGAAFLFNSPREGAELLWDETWGGERPANVGSWALGKIINALNPTPAPPRYERPLNAQEAETTLCKWKAYRNGRYHIGEDIEATHKGLQRFPQCQLSAKLLAAGSQAGLW